MVLSLAELTSGCEKSEVVSESPVPPIFEKSDFDSSPGCSVAASDNGKLVESSNYGMANLDHEIAIGSETIFH